MLDIFKRQAFHMDLIVKPMPEDAPIILFDEFIDDLITLIANDEAVYLFAKNTKALRIRDCVHDQENMLLHLLVNYADSNLTDPSFANLETGDLRIEPKLLGEGIAVSTHLTIDLVPEDSGKPIYKAYLEDVPGIGRTKLIPFLTALPNKAGVNIPWKDPSNAERKSRPKIELAGSLNQTLQDDLKDGKLSQIELSKFSVTGKFDEDGVVQEDRRTIVLKVKKNLKDKTVDLLNRIKSKATDQGYTDMKVTYSKTNSRQTSKQFGTAREDAGDVMTIKSSDITLATPRLQCEPEFRDDVAAKLRELALRNRPHHDI